MKQLPLLFYFYRHYMATAGLIISMLCWYSCFRYGLQALALLLMAKLVTDALMYGIAALSRSSRMLYYYNRHLSPAALWLFAILTDLFIFMLGVCIILAAREMPS